MLRRSALTMVVAVLIQSASAQQTHFLTLQEALRLAAEQSPAADIAYKNWHTAGSRFKGFKAQLLPSARLDAVLPSYTRSFSPITLDDGTVSFIEQSQADYSLDVQVDQIIPHTNTRLSLSSGLSRNDNYGDDKTTSYLSSPIHLRVQQPLFQYNEWRWRRKIEPLLQSESEKTWLESMQFIALDAIDHYFDAYLSIINLRIEDRNYNNADTLYYISNGRYNLGRIAENELLQMELSLLNAEADREDAKLERKLQEHRIKRFLAIPAQDRIVVMPADSVPLIAIDGGVALQFARQGNPLYDRHRRRLLEGEQGLAQARSGHRFSADLTGSIGLSNSAATFADSYQSTRNQQGLRLGLTIPILDWGSGKADIAIARNNQEIGFIEVNNELRAFEEDLLIEVERFNAQAGQVRIAEKADKVAEKRYEVAKNRYLIGKIGITDLNIASVEKDTARRGLVRALRNYWVAYYNIRSLTMYDFLAGSPLR